jgi:hypothetical protein
MANQPSDLRPGDDPRPNPPYGLWHNLRGANGQDAGVVSTPLRAALSPVGGSILSSFRGFFLHRVHLELFHQEYYIRSGLLQAQIPILRHSSIGNIRNHVEDNCHRLLRRTVYES